MDAITIRRPDDWHAHLRDGWMLQGILRTHNKFNRVLAMPNLVPPVRTTEECAEYQKRINACEVPDRRPMVHHAAYLTDETDPHDLAYGFLSGLFVSAKWYPAGATTNSDRGVTSVDKIRPVLDVMQDLGMPLCIHAETTNPEVDIFEREHAFMVEVLWPLLYQDFPKLKVVIEHATDRRTIGFVLATAERRRREGASHGEEGIAATITPHHLWWGRNALFEGGLQPDRYCLPILKKKEDMCALREAAISGTPWFFAGTDSAPHVETNKYKACGCAGVYNALTAIEAYAQIFASMGRLEQLEGFMSVHGAQFYGMPLTDETIDLVREDWDPPSCIFAYEPVGPYAREVELQSHRVNVSPLMAAFHLFLGGTTLQWRIQ